ncbi:MAG TPA: twin-arginine translocase TatA/TatE family subunit [Thermoanaerobaculia bacterium]
MHLLLIFGILMILFGGQKLPQLGKGLGEAISSFKSGLNGSQAEKPADKQITQ